jgi:hypothetical protein
VEVDMKSETLRNIRTMRQVKNSLDVAANQKLKTTNSLFKSPEETQHLESTGLNSNQTNQILAREKARAAKFEASVDRSQQKLLRSREKIAGLVNRNRALTALRHDIQRQRDQKRVSDQESHISIKPEILKHEKLRGIELKY